MPVPQHDCCAQERLVLLLILCVLQLWSLHSVLCDRDCMSVMGKIRGSFVQPEERLWESDRWPAVDPPSQNALCPCEEALARPPFFLLVFSFTGQFVTLPPKAALLEVAASCGN